MNGLNQTIDSIRAKPSDVARADAVAELQGIVRDCEAAIRVWQNRLDATDGTGNHWTLVSWLGADRVQQLHEISLSARAHLLRLNQIAGPSTSAAPDEDVIETAFRSLQPGEPSPGTARAAIARMNGRIAHLRALLERFRTPNPAAPLVRAKAAPRKTVGRKRRASRRRAPAKKTTRTRTTPSSRRKKAAKRKK